MSTNFIVLRIKYFLGSGLGAGARTVSVCESVSTPLLQELMIKGRGM